MYMMYSLLKFMIDMIIYPAIIRARSCMQPKKTDEYAAFRFKYRNKDLKRNVNTTY